jgi:hypothetical protein
VADFSMIVYLSYPMTAPDLIWWRVIRSAKSPVCLDGDQLTIDCPVKVLCLSSSLLHVFLLLLPKRDSCESAV